MSLPKHSPKPDLNPALRRLLSGWSISMIGDALNQAASVFLVLALAGGDGLRTGLIIGLRLASRLLFAGIGGALADRIERRALLVALDLCMAGCALLFVCAGMLRRLSLIYLLSILMGALSAAHAAARPVHLHDAAGNAGLDRALALLHSAFGISVFLGSGIGGLLIAALGAPAAFALDSLSFLVSAWCTWSAGRIAAPAQGAAPGRTQQASIARDWCSGARYLAQQPLLLRMVLTNALWSLGGGGVFVMISLLCWQRFPGDPLVLGLFFAMTGAGALLAVSVRPHLGRSPAVEARILGLSCIAEGLLFILLPYARPLAAALPIAALQLGAAFLFGLIYQPMLLRLSASEMRGRVSGLDSGIYLSLYGLAALGHGLLAERLGLAGMAWIAGGLMIGAGGFWLSSKPVRAYSGGHPSGKLEGTLQTN